MKPLIAGVWRTYEEYLLSDSWRQRRSALLEIVRECEVCGARKYLCVHHISYYNVGNEDRGDLMVVCRECHTKIERIKKGEKLILYRNAWIAFDDFRRQLNEDLEHFGRNLNGRELKFVRLFISSVEISRPIEGIE